MDAPMLSPLGDSLSRRTDTKIVRWRNNVRVECGVAQDMPLHLREKMAAWPVAIRSEENSLYLQSQPSQGPCVYHNPAAFSHTTGAPSLLPLLLPLPYK